MLKSTPQVASEDEGASQERALRSLFDQEESRLLRYAFSLTGRKAVAEEIVQEVFFQLHARWKEVDNPHSWLVRSVRNRSFNYLRKNKREVLNELVGDVADLAEQNGGASPEEALQRMESVAAIRNSLADLSEQDRELVQLKYFENLKYRDISEKTGLSVSNVGYRLHHILKELAKKLQQLGIDGQA